MVLCYFNRNWVDASASEWWGSDYRNEDLLKRIQAMAEHYRGTPEGRWILPERTWYYPVNRSGGEELYVLLTREEYEREVPEEERVS